MRLFVITALGLLLAVTGCTQPCFTGDDVNNRGSDCSELPGIMAEISPSR